MASISSPSRLTGFSGMLDTESIIQKLMAAERVPLDNILKKKQFTLWKRQDYMSMNTKLLSFKNTINELRFESNYEKQHRHHRTPQCWRSLRQVKMLEQAM